ncbi:MAG: hydantoinase/oxoprolinase family protein [Gammaproteobacteria bacterium]
MSRYLLGVDVGGTFTDFVACDRDTHAVHAWKNLTVPDDPTAGILQGLATLDDLAAVDTLRLGTTVATNALLERNGARVAYVTTAGFRDVPFLQRGNRAHHYDSSWIKPRPLVRRRDCFELEERVTSAGEVLTSLDDAAVRELGQRIAATGGIEAVAVNFLFSYLEPRHERRARELLAEALGDVPISISSEVLPKWKEYERASTVLADAYIKPVVHRYLRDMHERFGAAGIRPAPVVMKSNGGEMTLAGAAAQPVHLTLSGPTGGTVAARHVAATLGHDHVVTFDMGGTSTDCSTIVDGELSFTTAFELEFGVPIQVPMIDIRTIGAGGGSLAWIDRGGMLRVGPASAGARPGPACYGFGGTEPTVTDANLVLGRLDPQRFLGGTMTLDVGAARAAVAGVAGHLGLGVEETALAILRIVNNNMVGALRTVLVERGLDPRDFSLLAFGGAGPLHVGELMMEAGIPCGVVPLHPGQFSALGFTFADARVDLERTVQMTSARFDCARASALLGDLVASARLAMREQGYTEPVRLERAIELRYLGQNYELELPYAEDAFDAASASALWDAFHARHEARFGFAIPGEVIELITLKCTAVVATDKPRLPPLAAATPAAPAATREVWFEAGPCATPVFAREALAPGQSLAGPALIEESASVTVLCPGQRLDVTADGHLVLTATR